jgi:hypothetical protein
VILDKDVEYFRYDIFGLYILIKYKITQCFLSIKLLQIADIISLIINSINSQMLISILFMRNIKVINYDCCLPGVHHLVKDI